MLWFMVYFNVLLSSFLTSVRTGPFFHPFQQRHTANYVVERWQRMSCSWVPRCLFLSGATGAGSWDYRRNLEKASATG
ncbi:hypothetical protein LZ30DRAFT_710204 [Colletotrichum cereale]|nr:hypothetical protein LZ30DRAFT_710204 [Colletotrichum cereale]